MTDTALDESDTALDESENALDADDALDGAVVLLTGGTSGIGRVAARRLAERGATVAVVGRSRDRGEQLADETATDDPGEIRFHRVDLSTQSAVRRLAEEIRETYDRLDVLAHNAGLAARTRTETDDGIERTLAVNHLAPYLLTHELLGLLQESRPSRIVVTASGIHRRATLDFDDLQFERGYDSMDAYARSKLANVAFTVELADRLAEQPADVTANCFHPGFVPSTNLFRDTPLWMRLGLRALAVVPGVATSTEEGARRLVRLATDPEFAERSGAYVGAGGVKAPKAEATDPEVCARLWNESAELVGVDPDWP